MNNVKNSLNLKNVSIYVSLSIISIICIFPLVWMILISFQPVTVNIGDIKAMFTTKPQFGNYTRVFDLMPFFKNLWNSFFTTIIGTATTLFFCSLAGFAFAKFEFPARNLLFYLLIGTMLIPEEVGIIPLFVIMKNLDLINSLWSIILPRTATAVGIFYMRQYIMNVPTEIIESARIDGSSDFRTFISIILPVIKPALASWAVITLAVRWNDFFWPLVLLRTQEKFTLMVSIALLPISDGLSTPWPVIMAGTSLAVIPIIVLYFIFQRYQLGGLTDGAVKG